MSELYHLIYASKATREFSKQDILDLLAKAREYNHDLNVHGMLLYDAGSFFQILEGEKDVLLDLFERISKDTRHTDIVRIIFEAIPSMSFPDWSMGYAEATRNELQEIDGMNDFFSGQTCLADIDSGRARKLLNAFAAGRWRLT
jgi:hypothetical protein